jgi:hypothetical protein
MTTVINTRMDIPTMRDIVNRNTPISHVVIKISTEEKWLPQVLTDLDFFKSNSEVKRNRPDLWRELIPGKQFFDLPWAHVVIEFNEAVR